MRGFARLLDWLPSVLLLCVACLTTLSVISRYLFSAPIPDEYDVSKLLLGVIFSWGIAGAFKSSSHIYLDVFVGLCGPKLRALLNRIGSILCLLLVGAILITMGYKVADEFQSSVVTLDLSLPVWLFYLASWIGVLAAFLVLLPQALGLPSGSSNPQSGSQGEEAAQTIASATKPLSK